MLFRTEYSIPTQLLQEAIHQVPDIEFRLPINEPTGRFFYDPWKISENFKDTIWHKLYDSLPLLDKGEARIIKLSSKEAYSSHADLDDRYHLNLSGSQSYLIDLENLKMHLLTTDGLWYEMDAGRLHTAANFGRGFRYQLVIRKLLIETTEIINNRIKIIIDKNVSLDLARYQFDNKISGILNQFNKNKKMKNFSWNDRTVEFELSCDDLSFLKNIEDETFCIEISSC